MPAQMARLVRASVRAAGARWVTRVSDRAGMDRLQPPRIVDLPVGQSLLVVAPHPDDESIGCGALVAKWCAGRRKAHVVFLTDGEIGSREIRAMAVGDERSKAMQVLAGTRRTEATAALAALGRPTAEFLSLPDGGLLGSIGDAAIRLAACLQRASPDLLVLPHWYDRHPDHVAATPIVLGALRHAALASKPAIMGYEIWAPLQAEVVIDADEFMDRKLAAIACYKSQTASVDYAAAVEGLNRYRAISAHAGCTYAEAFRLGTPEDLARIWETMQS